MKFLKTHRKASIAGLALIVAAVTGGAAYAYWTSSGSGTGSAQDATATGLVINQDPNGAPIYDSLVSPLPGSFPSQPFQAQQTSEFGNEINVVSSSEPLNNVVVTMEDWACENWATIVHTCVTTPGASFAMPITLTLYQDSGSGVVGNVIATDTQTFNIPFRPSSNAVCSGDPVGWLDNATTAAQFGVNADNKCHFGLANNITFDFSSQPVVLSGSVIYGISYNTQSYGAVPYGVNGPYNSLNVALAKTATGPTVGTDTFPGQLDWSTVTAGDYCDGGAGGSGTFRLDTKAVNPTYCWSVGGSGAPYYLPAVEFNVSSANGDLYPGGPAQPINFSVTNPGTIAEALNTVTIGISSITNQHPTVGDAVCDPGWFVITQPGPINGSVAAGATFDDNPSGASISLTNLTLQDQDACQGATVNLTFTSN